GSAGAGAMLAVMSERLVALSVGTLVLVAVGVSLLGFCFRRTPLAMLFVGAVAGFMGTAAAVSGPPIALAYQEDPGPVIRATLSRFFLAGTCIAIAALVPAGRLGLYELGAGLALLPGVAVGVLFSRRLHPVLDTGRARPAVLAVAAISAAGVLLKELL
ncbi:MAG TPA: TSUP family transporter, partial [Actinomycetota bacterium]|nr:TSUP family transporter [Actinomycetota bacterium]